LRHDLPKFRLTEHDISAGLSFPSKRFDRFEQPFGRQPRQLPYPSSCMQIEAFALEHPLRRAGAQTAAPI